LDRDREITALRRWDAPDAAARVLAHPRFGRAARELARRMLALVDADPTLARALKDAGRYAATMGVLQLHATGGVTVPRLKALSASTGLLSPGRARALIGFLEHVGFVARARPARRGSATLYVPTPALLRGWETQMREALEACRLIEPAVASLIAGLSEPDVLLLFTRLHAEGLVASMGGGTVSPPLAPFLHADAGARVLSELIACETDGRFPPQRSGPISLSAMARRFKVSRLHLSRLVQGAERAGLVRIGTDRFVTLTPRAQDEFAVLYAAQLAQVLAAAGRTAHAWEALARAA
jgi:hypothetical protein